MGKSHQLPTTSTPRFLAIFSNIGQVLHVRQLLTDQLLKNLLWVSWKIWGYRQMLWKPGLRKVRWKFCGRSKSSFQLAVGVWKFWLVLEETLEETSCLQAKLILLISPQITVLTLKLVVKLKLKGPSFHRPFPTLGGKLMLSLSLRFL